MSQRRASRRGTDRSSYNKGSVCDQFNLKEVMNPLLLPITSSINALNETVSALVCAWNTREEENLNGSLNLITPTEFSTSNITLDVMASDIHQLSKSYNLLKDQYCNYKQALHDLHEKMCSLEKLIITMVKKKAKKETILNPSVLDIFHKFENYLLSNKKLPTNGQNVQLNGDKLQSNGDCKVSIATLIDQPSTIHVGKMQIVTLNKEEDYPLGSWLGNPSVSKSRVRCSIRPDDLIYINLKCSTPEKMALTLLDFLFSKDILAVSNLSGKGKLGKTKLDPLLIYGIKCHLRHIFSINEKQWERIKLKIDSKCRTAWRKRRMVSDCTSLDNEIYPEDSQSQDSFKNYIENFVCNEGDGSKATVIRTAQGDIEILEAEEVLLHNLHNIQVLEGDHVLPTISSDGEDGENEITLTSSQSNQLAVISESDLDTVSFVMEPMMEVLTEDVPLTAEELNGLTHTKD